MHRLLLDLRRGERRPGSALCGWCLPGQDADQTIRVEHNTAKGIRWPCRALDWNCQFNLYYGACHSNICSYEI